MAFIIDCLNETEMFGIIKERLKRRGLQLTNRENWEVHGSHPDFNYQVYCGPAKYLKIEPFISHDFNVVIYPRKVYADLNYWNMTDPDQVIKILKNGR